MKTNFYLLQVINILLPVLLKIGDNSRIVGVNVFNLQCLYITEMGILYVVPTPVGNLEDITFRVLRILKEVDLIGAEDTRHSIKLLNHFEIKNTLTSFFRHNEDKKGEYIVTVAPKKTKLIECYINGGQRAHRRVIVIEPEKYDEVMKDWGRKVYNSRYLDKLAGGVPLF